jgi:hypothetical protein
MRDAQAWTDKMTARGLREIFGRQRLHFNGKRRGGGPEGWTPRGGGAGESEGERGGLGAAWSRTVAWRRRSSDPAMARAGGALPHDSGERRGRHDAVDVADRWVGARRGPGHQCLGVARGSAVRRSEWR